VKDIHTDMEAPEGYEFTGEFRWPKEDEPFCVPGDPKPWLYVSGAMGKRLILRKIENVVQVIFDVGYRRYSYIDPTGQLDVGDLVEVPTGYHNNLTVGKVAALGRGSYKGDLKTITAKYVRILL